LKSHSSMKTIAVILAAGKGRRFSDQSGSSLKKQYARVEDQPLWARAAAPFEALPFVEGIVVVCPETDIPQIQEQISLYSLTKIAAVIAGGKERRHSTTQALLWIRRHRPSCEFVFIHDGVRPFLTQNLIQRLWDQREWGAVIPTLEISDTIKSVHEDQVDQTLDRRVLRRAQTPQLFKLNLLWAAFEKLQEDVVTDDAGVVERAGIPVKVITGDPRNVKITVPQDLDGHGMRQKNSVGFGVDVHAFCEGREIVLGGIRIPYPCALKGHSDADVLVHAMCDALLGAAGLSDMGSYFPETDPQYKNISSLVLLSKVMEMLGANQYTIAHIDATVMAEAPRLAPYISEMRLGLSRLMRISKEHLAIKATTSEGLGFIGRKEGICAMAVVTLEKKSWI